MVEYRLDLPPSTNAIWRAVKGRVIKSRRYRAWLELGASQIASQGLIQVVGRVGVLVSIHPPNRRAMDLDNRCKGLGDLLQSAGVIEDDSHIDELHVCRREIIKGGLAVVRVWNLSHD